MAVIFFPRTSVLGNLFNSAWFLNIMPRHIPLLVLLLDMGIADSGRFPVGISRTRAKLIEGYCWHTL